MMQAITVPISPGVLSQVRHMAKSAEIGGRSNIRNGNRQETLEEDQLVGQVCEAAFHIYFNGHILEWRRNRWFRNQMPMKGDNGSDVPPSNIDVKGSRIRNSNLPLEKYHLAVRPNEIHPNTVYVLGIAENDLSKVYLLGWADNTMLPDRPDESGTFSGAYVIPAIKLIPLPPIVWKWTTS